MGTPVLSCGGCGFALRWYRVQCGKAQGQKLSSAATGEETEMADAHKALGEQVQQEAAQELIERQRHQLLLIVVSGVAPTKGDLAVLERNQSVFSGVRS